MRSRAAWMTTMLAAALASLAAVGSAHAGMGWGPQQGIPDSPSTDRVTVAVDGAGGAVIGLRGMGSPATTMVTARPAAGAAFFAPVATLWDTDVAGTAIAPDGTALAAATDGEAVLLRTILPGATAPTPPTTIAGHVCCGQPVQDPASPPQVAAAADGSAAAAWLYNTGGTIQARWALRPSDGSAFGPSGASDEARFVTGPIRLAMNAAGDALAVWIEYVDPNGGEFEPAIRAVSRRAGGAFGPVVTLASGHAAKTRPEVALGADGSAIVAWTQTDDFNTSTAHDAAYAVSRRGADGTWTATARVTAPGVTAGSPAVATDGRGGVLVAAVQAAPPVPEGPFVWAWDGAAGGALGAGARLAGHVFNPAGLAAALGGDGRSIVTWGDVNRTYAAVRPAAGAAFAPAVELPAPGTSANHGDPSAPVAFDDHGDALVAWVDGTYHLAWRVWDGDEPAGPPPAGGPGAGPSAPAGPAASATGATDPAAVSPSIVVSAAAPALARRRCAVPRLALLTPAAARRRLATAHCALGRVTKPKAYKNRTHLVVRRQSRRAGTRAAGGAHVDVTLGPKPAKKRRHGTRDRDSPSAAGSQLGRSEDRAADRG